MKEWKRYAAADGLSIIEKNQNVSLLYLGLWNLWVKRWIREKSCEKSHSWHQCNQNIFSYNFKNDFWNNSRVKHVLLQSCSFFCQNLFLFFYEVWKKFWLFAFIHMTYHKKHVIKGHNDVILEINKKTEEPCPFSYCRSVSFSLFFGCNLSDLNRLRIGLKSRKVGL